MKYLKQSAHIIVLIGGLNWGVYGVSGYNVIEVLLGGIPMIANIVYVLVGLSALYMLIQKYATCSCSKSCVCDTSCACHDHSCASTETSTKEEKLTN